MASFLARDKPPLSPFQHVRVRQGSGRAVLGDVSTPYSQEHHLGFSRFHLGSLRLFLLATGFFVLLSVKMASPGFGHEAALTDMTIRAFFSATTSCGLPHSAGFRFLRGQGGIIFLGVDGVLTFLFGIASHDIEDEVILIHLLSLAAASSRASSITSASGAGSYLVGATGGPLVLRHLVWRRRGRGVDIGRCRSRRRMKGLSLTWLFSHLSLLGFPLLFGFFSILLFLRPRMFAVAAAVVEVFFALPFITTKVLLAPLFSLLA